MFLRRILFQLSLVTVILCAAYVGISGAEAIAVDIFGEEYFEGPSTIFSPRLWFGIPFMVVCCSISSFGALFLFVLPVITWFPEECRVFKPLHQPSKGAAKILRWYSIALEKQADEAERSA